MFSMNRKIILAVLVLVLTFMPGCFGQKSGELFAQEEQKQEADSADFEKSFSEKLKVPAFVKQRLEKIQARLVEWNNIDREAVAKQYMVSETDVSTRINMYNAVESFYRRLVTAMEKTSTLSQEVEKMEAIKGQAAGSLVEEKPP